MELRDLTEELIVEIYMMQKGHLLWDETISFAQNCSWRAGPVLAERMKENAFNDWERVCVAVEDGCIAGYCTFTGKDELADQYDYSPFIGFVFVDERYRGRRISQQMILQTLQYARAIGFKTVYLMSGEHGLYEKYGFEKMGDYQTIYGTTDQLFHIDLR